MIIYINDGYALHFFLNPKLSMVCLWYACGRREPGHSPSPEADDIATNKAHIKLGLLIFPAHQWVEIEKYECILSLQNKVHFL